MPSILRNLAVVYFRSIVRHRMSNMYDLSHRLLQQLIRDIFLVWGLLIFSVAKVSNHYAVIDCHSFYF